jgi:signal transduction histidine kinase
LAEQSNLAKARFSFEGRTERLIAAGRVILASFSLLAIWLDPSEPAKYAALAYLLLASYVLYSVVLALFIWTAYRHLAGLTLVTHIFDLGIFSLFMYFTEGPTSPFFVYFIFSMLCATLRWQWRGTLWTALAALVTFLGMGFYAEAILKDPAFELNRFIIRAVYLAVVAVFLGYLGAHELLHRNQLSKLAAWAHTRLLDFEKVIGQVLEHAGSILEAPRVLLAWEEPEEPWVNLVIFSDRRHHWSRKPPGTFDALVAAPLEGKSFFSQHVGDSRAVMAESGSRELRRWRGEPLNQELVKLFNIESVLSVSVSAETLQGRIFFLDKSSLTSDDLTLAEVVAVQVAASMDLSYSLQRLQQFAAVEERMRVAHDLHDGILQSLTVAGLRLEQTLRIVKENPEGAAEQLRDIQNLIYDEQRDIRILVQELKPKARVPSETEFAFGRQLEQLGKTVGRERGFRVEIKLDGSESRIPVDLAREIYLIVREGLINAARHSEATSARVKLAVEERQVRICIADDGRGFPFRGTYNHDLLTAMGLGPVMLKSRVASLEGSLTIHSTDAGSRIEITVPLSRARG